MKTFCTQCGRAHEYAVASAKPNFCSGCGSAMNPVAQAATQKKKVVAKVKEEEDEDEDEIFEDDIEVPTDIKVTIEGVRDWRSDGIEMASLINQTQKSQKSLRPPSKIDHQQMTTRIRSRESIEVA